MSKGLYFVAVVPEQPLYSEVIELKQEMCKRFNSCAALRSPPHITLVPPFWYEKNDENKLLSILTSVKSSFPFSVQLNGFDCFKPRVIFIHNEPSEELKTLQKNLEGYCYERHIISSLESTKRPFHPHMTIAFKDLTKEAFHDAWAEFKNKEFRGQFVVRDFKLLVHRERKWDILQSFS